MKHKITILLTSTELQELMRLFPKAAMTFENLPTTPLEIMKESKLTINEA